MSLCEGRECGDEQLKTWGRAQAAAGSQCVAVCTLCTAHVVLRLMKLCRTREVTPLLQLPGLGWVLTADVVTNVPGQQLCQGTGGGSDVVRAKHATLHRHYVASSLHAHTGTRRHFDISNRNHARIQEYKMTHHDTYMNMTFYAPHSWP